MAGLAAEANGEELIGVAETALVVADGASDPEVVATVGHLSELADDDLRLGERLVDAPERAGAARVGEVHASCGLALGHIAGAVDANEGKGDSSLIGALQGGEAGGDRFIAHAEDLAEVLDVVAGCLSLGMHEAVGQESGGREVTGDATLGKIHGGLGCEGLVRHERRDIRAGLKVAELRGHAESALSGAQPRGELERAGLRVEAVERIAEVGLRADLNIVFLAQARGNGRLGVADSELCDVQVVGETLGLVVEIVEIVLPGIEEIADLVMWHGQRLRTGATTPRVRDQRELIAYGAVTAVDVDERACDGRVVINEFRKFLKLDRRGGDFLVLNDVLDFGEETGIIVAREERGVDAEDLRDLHEDRHGEWTDIMFDLVDVAGGQAERRRERGLGKISFAAELAEAGADVGLGHVS